MAIRILLVLAVLTIFFGCGRPSSPPGQNETEGGAEPKSAISSAPAQPETTQQETEAVNTNSVGSCADKGSTSGQREAGRSEESEDTQLAFTRTIASDSYESELYVMNADGTNETRLTNSRELSAKILVTSPDWSPDGKRIAYLRGIDVDTGRTDSDIYMINADGSNPSSLATVQQSTFSWSPDGQKIAFDGYTRSGDTYGRQGIYMINPDGTGLEYLTEGTGFSWSPDGKKLAYVRGAYTADSTASATDVDIFVRRIDGGDPTRLTNTPEMEESGPVWSPDGRKVAFASVNASGNDIYVINADGSGQTKLTNNKTSAGQYAQQYDDPAWSPDSKKIAVQWGSRIYVMHADGTCETHLTEGTDFSWSPDGQKIAFTSASSGQNDIYVINADGSGQTNLTNSKQSEDFFAWSPAGVGTITERTKQEIEEREAVDSAPEEEALQAYIEQINGLLREKDLRGSEESSDVRRKAREKTLEVLEGSDPSTKEKAVRFLAQAGLVQDVGQRVPIISLSNTDLENANLSGIDLRGADFRTANLASSDLQKADLSGADLTRANLTNANLTDVQLQRANMTNATLHATDLNRADLTGADLTGVYMTATEQKQAEQSATGVYVPVENKAQVRTWEAEARNTLKDVYADFERCLATIARVEDWDYKDSPEAIRDSKIVRCTNSADSDTFFKYYEDDLHPNVSWTMIRQTKPVGMAREETGEVVIKIQHKQGGSAFQTSTAANGRIERIPRF